jgi:hypothetical protein
MTADARTAGCDTRRRPVRDDRGLLPPDGGGGPLAALREGRAGGRARSFDRGRRLPVRLRPSHPLHHRCGDGVPDPRPLGRQPPRPGAAGVHLSPRLRPLHALPLPGPPLRPARADRQGVSTRGSTASTWGSTGRTSRTSTGSTSTRTRSPSTACRSRPPSAPIRCRRARAPSPPRWPSRSGAASTATRRSSAPSRP